MTEDELRRLLELNPDMALIVYDSGLPVRVRDVPTSDTGRGHKYNATKTEVDGITFDSKKEANEYANLRMLERAGVITGLVLQPRFELEPPFTDNEGKRHRGEYYVADFAYQQDGQTIVVDVKGYPTAHYKSKAKRFRAKYSEYRYIIK